MRILTLIPEVADLSAYGAAIFLVYAIGGFALAAHVQNRWLAQRGVHFLVPHVTVLTLTFGAGLARFGTEPFLRPGALQLALAIPAGFLAGLAATRTDRAIVRALLRDPDRPRRRTPARAPKPVAARSATQRRAAGTRDLSAEPLSLHDPMPLPLLVAGAALEELVIRGLLLGRCMNIADRTWFVLAIAGTVVAFAASHLFLGWAHAAAKLPLALLTTMLVLVTGAVAAAVVAHIVFNGLVWRDQRLRSVVLDRTVTA